MVKTTGIVRRLDELGRIVIPIEIRNKLGLQEKDSLEILTEGCSIILRKDSKNCIICNQKKDILEIKGKNVCKKCIEDMKNFEV